MKILLAAACFAFLLLNLNAAGVESRRCRCDDNGDDNDDGDDSDQSSYKLFVFGDSFADNGNLPKGDLDWATRFWYEPFGMSDDEHDNKPTGRCSDGMLQSDFIAKILGLKESPPPERVRRQDGVDLSSGMNFAISGAGVTVGWNLDTQIDRLRKLLRHGTIDKDLSQAVALVAISGDDYADFPAEAADQDLLIRNVTDGIADGVKQIKELGIDNVLVNLLPPIGCNPWNTRRDNYTKCEKDVLTGAHNNYLLDKLGDDDSVLLLDLDTVFRNIVVPKTTKLFYHRHIPCCLNLVADVGFCGQLDGDGNKQYTLCDKPDEYFYWDNTNPTQAGWKAVMKQLEGPIKDFLGI